MKLQSLQSMLVAAALMIPVGAGQALANPRTGFFFVPEFYSGYPYNPYGGGVGITPYGGYGNYGTQYAYPSPLGGYGGYGYYGPTYYSYVMPYPAYGILPPPFLTERDGSTSRNTWSGKTAEDYGYSADAFDRTPRKRGSMYPAVPFEGAAQEKDPLVEARRLRLTVTVPKADATVLIDGAATSQKGLERTYITPPLEYDHKYMLTVEARWTDEKGERKETQKVDVVVFPNSPVARAISFK